jgi:hypothetical protein
MIALCFGCESSTSLNNPGDLSTNLDLAMPGVLDMAVVDQNVNEDLSTIQDMTLPGDATRFVNFTMYLENAATAICNNLLACGQIDSTMIDACKELQKAQQAAPFDIDAEMVAGRLKINDIQCVTARMNARCDGTDEGRITGNGPCGNGLYVPEVLNGNGCVASVECKSGYCLHPPKDGGVPGEGCFGGTCTAYLPTGTTAASACPLGVECNPTNSFCDFTGHCQASTADNAACANSLQCMRGAYCAFAVYPGSPAGLHVCTRPTGSGTEGQPCDVDQNVTAFPSCAAGLYCSHTADGGTTTGPGTCRAMIASGSACSLAEVIVRGIQFGTPCTDGTDCYKLAGETQTTCRALGAVGGNCNPTDAHCDVTLNCVQTTDATHGTCQPAPRNGAICSLSSVPPCLGATLGVGECLAVAAPDAGAGMGACVLNRGWGDPCTVLPDQTTSYHPQCFFTGICDPTQMRCLASCPN